jgi:hypothetical protein
VSQNNIVAAQSFLIFLQMVNAQIAVVTKSALVALIVGAVIGGLQYYIQNAGNASLPPGAASAGEATQLRQTANVAQEALSQQHAADLASVLPKPQTKPAKW